MVCSNSAVLTSPRRRDHEVTSLRLGLGLGLGLGLEFGLGLVLGLELVLGLGGR